MDSQKTSNDRLERQGTVDKTIAMPLNQAGQASLALGRYQIQEELGRGAMGAVYKAFDPLIARTVALKTILIDSNAPAEMVERLKQEAKAAGGLDHPNIITIYDVGEENGAVYLSMQFVQGTTLAKLLAEVGVPSLPTFISWADQISAAVGFAHARGVIHRDLKPANLMVTEQGTIKVLDFGIAKIENTSLTQTGLVVGTPGYMAPEQIAGKKIDHRADIFSLGAVFYELLTREKPFAGDIATILYKIVNEDPIAPTLINPAIPGGIDAVVRKALAKDPKDRFQSCEEMRKAFLEQSVRAPLVAPASVTPPKPVSKRPQSLETPRRPSPAKNTPQVRPGLIVAAALALAATIGWSFHVRSRTGSFPPVVAKLEGKIKPLPSGTGQSTTPATQLANGTAGSVSVTPVPGQNDATAGASATISQTATTPTASDSAGAPTLQPVAAQSEADHPSNESASNATSSVGSSSVEASQKPSPFHTAPPSQPAPEASNNNQPPADNATAHSSATSPFAPREDDGPSPSTTTPKLLPRKRAAEASGSVDGFTRQDIPDLLRQADSSAARGDYRLAHYEYGLVLKLDRNNVQAREGLRRLLVAWQSR